MRNVRDLFTCCLFVLGLVLPSWAQGVLENPSASSFQSGIGIISGWKCNPGTITVGFDGSAAQVQAAAGTSRADTAGACGGSANNGFGLLWNFNLLGTGAHTVRVFNNGVQFASAAFTVTTLGGEFLSGLSGQCDLKGFPHFGKEVALQWQESNQNFVLASASDLQPVELIANQVANLTEVTVTTVPAGKRLVITDVVISNDNSGAACCQRIFRNGTAVTAFITVGAGSSFSHTFETGIEFAAGDNVVVRNGASSGPIHFYLRGFLTNP